MIHKTCAAAAFPRAAAAFPRAAAAFLVAAAAFLVAAAPAPCLAASYDFVPLASLNGSPNAPYVYLQGVDKAGDLIGYTAGTGTGDNGFIDQNGVFSQLGPSAPPTGYDRPTGISQAGLVVGFASQGGGGAEFGYEIDAGQLTQVALPDGTPVFPFGINNRGQIVGSTQLSGATGSFMLSGTRVTPINVPHATATLATSINDNGQIAGTYTDAAGSHGFLFVDGLFRKVGPHAGAGRVTAAAVNDKGDIAGTFFDAAGNQHGFVERKGHYRTIDYPGNAGGTAVTAINNKGEIVGQYVSSRNGNDETLAGFFATPAR